MTLVTRSELLKQTTGNTYLTTHLTRLQWVTTIGFHSASHPVITHCLAVVGDLREFHQLGDLRQFHQFIRK